MSFDALNPRSHDKVAIFTACSKIKNKLGINWEEFFKRAKINVGHKFEDNLRKGNISPEKFSMLHEWIVQNHLTIGVKYAPEIFDESQLSNWDSFLDKFGEWYKVDIHSLEEINLTAHSHKNPKSKTRITLGHDFCFWMHSPMDGAVIGLEEYKGCWYPIPLGQDGVDLITNCKHGQRLFPINTDTNEPISLSDEKHDGIHGYVFFVGDEQAIKQINRMINNGNAMSPELLKRIAYYVEQAGKSISATYRLNVLFKH